MISRQKLLNLIVVLYLLFPIVISYVLKILGILIPTYLLILILIILIIIISISINKFQIYNFKNSNFSFFIFLLWILLSYFYSPSLISKENKVVLLFYDIICPVLLFSFFRLTNSFNFNIQSLEISLLKTTYILIWILFVFFLFSKQHDESGRYYLPGSENSILFSRNISTYLIILITIKHKCSHILRYLTLLLALILLFASASKGPMVGLLIIVYYYFIKNNNKNALQINIAFFSALLLIIFLLFLIDQNNYLFDTNFYSLFARQEYFRIAFENLNFNLFKGVGIGSFALVFLGEDIISYPHNIFVEIFLENGLIGLLLLIVLLFKFYINFSLNIISLLILFFLISAQFSGDIPGNNNFFILFYIYFAFFINNKLNHSLIEA
jgi:hypothetical protein